jgi:hypothetical protein
MPRITVDAGSYGNYTVSVSGYWYSYGGFMSAFDTSQTSGSLWPFHGYAEEVTGNYESESMIKFCHGPECCYSPVPDDDDTLITCTAGHVVTITLKKGGVGVAFPDVVLRVDTYGGVNWYEQAISDFLSPRAAARHFRSYFRATGGPFQHEKVSAIWFQPHDQALLNSNKSVLV